MNPHEVNIKENCTKEEFIEIINSIGLTHSEPDYIESDLSKLRGKTVKINADKNKIIISYVVPIPDKKNASKKAKQ